MKLGKAKWNEYLTTNEEQRKEANEALMKIMLRQMDAPLVMMLTDVMSQDDILQRKLSSSNNS